MKEHKFQQKIIRFLNSEIAAGVFFILVGLCLVAFPVQTVDIICRIVFGILLIFAGLYNIGMYLYPKVQTTVFNMFAGVIVLVLGWFMFENPQIVVKLLPRLLGALLFVGSIWMVQTAVALRKTENPRWNAFLIAGFAGIALGVITIINPFGKVRQTILFAGIAFLIKGMADIIFSILLKREPKEKAAVPAESYSAPLPGTDVAPAWENSGEALHDSPQEKEPHHGPFHNFAQNFGGAPEEERHFGDADVYESADAYSTSNVGGGNAGFGEQNTAEAENEVLEEWKD